MKKLLWISRILPPFLAYRMKHAWLDRKIPRSGWVWSRPVYCRQAVQVDLADEVDRNLAFLGSNNVLGMAAAASVLSRGDTVYEFGANVGTETLSLSALVGNLGRVVAVEADSKNVAKLAARLQYVGMTNVSVLRHAVCSISGTVLLQSGPLHNSGAARIELAAGGGEDRDAVRVPTIKGDELLNTFPPPKLLMMDIEGAELSALESCQRLLAACRPAIILEVSARLLRDMDASPEQVFQYLSKEGYRICYLQKLGTPIVKDEPFPRDLHTDWLALPGEGGDRLLKRIRRRLLAARTMPRFRFCSPLARTRV